MQFLDRQNLLLSGAILAGLLVAAHPASSAAEVSSFRITHEHFMSGGAEILVDVYTPLTKARRPPILLFHGAGGMLFDGPEIGRIARALAGAGFQAYQVHYFDRTNTWFARQAVLLKLFPTWLATVHDAVEWVRARRPDAPQVGLYGYSLGAFASLEEARRNRPLARSQNRRADFGKESRRARPGNRFHPF